MPGPVFLDGDRVTLRPIEEEDLEFLQAQVNDSQIWRPIGRSRPVNREQEREFFENDVCGDDTVVLLIVADSTPVGTVGLLPSTGRPGTPNSATGSHRSTTSGATEPTQSSASSGTRSISSASTGSRPACSRSTNRRDDCSSPSTSRRRASTATSNSSTVSITMRTGTGYWRTSGARSERSEVKTYSRGSGAGGALRLCSLRSYIPRTRSTVSSSTSSSRAVATMESGPSMWVARMSSSVS